MESDELGKIIGRFGKYCSECIQDAFTNKKVVDEEELLAIVDELKGAMPDEVEQARKVLAERG